jgi:hypothetical protein
MWWYFPSGMVWLSNWRPVVRVGALLQLSSSWGRQLLACWHCLAELWKGIIDTFTLANLTTKIITLIEFFNFVSEVSRLQYEWLLSDCWYIWKYLGVNACLQWRNVFSFHWRSVFVNFFCKFFEFIFDCTCALADQSLYAGIVYEHYWLCPGWPYAQKSFKKVGLVYVHDVPWMLGCETGHVGPM